MDPQNVGSFPERISGKKIIIRPAVPEDRRPVFEWLTRSDLTHRMMGPPTYPDSPVPTWKEFINDYREHFFDGSDPYSGRCYIIQVKDEAIGQINHDRIHIEDYSTELDIWLKSSKYTHRGFGTDAILTLCNYLTTQYGCKIFKMAPSKRNTIAVRAYEKAGFIPAEENTVSAHSEYPDALLMIRTLR